MASEDPSEYFYHEHHDYVFSLRPLHFIVQEAICPDSVIFNGGTFMKLCEGKICTYVCQHPDPTPAHTASINTTEKTVLTLDELFNVATWTTPMPIFKSQDFKWVT